MRFFLLAFFVLAFLGCGKPTNSTVSDVNPLGQHADYILDHNPQRTSSFITAGSAKVSVTGEAIGVSKQYDVCVDYSFTASLITKKGNKCQLVDEYLFTQAFMTDVRQHPYIGTDFTVEHEGYVDLPMYPNCDLLKVYDFKIDLTNGQVQNMVVILTKTDPSLIPVAGIAKIDVSGLAEGFEQFQAGFNYTSN